MYIFFLCIFSFMFNFNFLSYNENFLLCVCFILFFTLIYSIIKKIFKEFIFLKILKNFFIIILMLKLNIYFHKLLAYNYILKFKIFFKYLYKIQALKKINKVKEFSLFDYYYFLISFLYFYNLNHKINMWIKERNFNWSFIKLYSHIKEYDLQLLFFTKFY